MAFDKDKPAAGSSLRSSNPEILANQSALETAANREHEFSTGGTAADQLHHKKGSARCYFQDAAPTTRVDGSAFNAQDNGSLWIDTNSDPDNQFNVLTDYSVPTWTPVSTEIIAVLLAANRIFAGTLKSTGDFTVGNDKVIVTAASGNTAIAGTLDVTGNIDPTTFENTNGGFLDEDDLASDAADKVASQQSIKKYIDDNIGSANYTPSSYVGEESVTLPNGMIMKHGYDGRSGNTTTITFGEAFPNDVVSAQVTLYRTSDGNAYEPVIRSLTTSEMTVYHDASATGYYWCVIGY